MYTVTYNAGSGILETAIGGFLDLSEIDNYIKAVHTVLMRNQLFRGYKMIIDVTDACIQSQGNLIRFKEHMHAMPKSDRIAVIAGNTIAVGQVKRLFTQPYAKIVHSRNEGIAWLSQ